MKCFKDGHHNLEPSFVPRLYWNILLVGDKLSFTLDRGGDLPKLIALSVGKDTSRIFSFCTWWLSLHLINLRHNYCY